MEFFGKYSQLSLLLDRPVMLQPEQQEMALASFSSISIPESWPVSQSVFFSFSYPILLIKTALYLLSQIQHFCTCVITYTGAKQYKMKSRTATPNWNILHSLYGDVTEHRRWNSKISHLLFSPQPVASSICSLNSYFTQVCCSLWGQSLSWHTATCIYFSSSHAALRAIKCSSPSWFTSGSLQGDAGLKVVCGPWAAGCCCPAMDKEDALISVLTCELAETASKGGDVRQHWKSEE